MIVGVCGYGCTGSGAVLSFLQQYEDCSFSRNDLEFTLPYMPLGLQDLEYHLTDNHARFYSSDFAIKGFMKQIRLLTRLNYAFREAGRQIKDLTKEYVKRITQVEWNGLTFNDCNFRNPYYTYLQIDSRIVRFYEKYTPFRWPVSKHARMYLAVNPPEFDSLTKKYILNVLQCLGYDFRKTVILNQPFEANEPENSMRFFDDAKAIIVDRDPRDVYILMKKYIKSAGNFSPSSNVDDFIQYWNLVRINRYGNANPDILRIKFEDLIYAPEKTVRNIEGFAELSGKVDQSRAGFDPKKSINNTQLFLKHQELAEDIEKIQSELKEYIYPFENYDIKPEHTSIPF